MKEKQDNLPMLPPPDQFEETIAQAKLDLPALSVEPLPLETPESPQTADISEISGVEKLERMTLSQIGKSIGRVVMSKLSSRGQGGLVLQMPEHSDSPEIVDKTIRQEIYFGDTETFKESWELAQKNNPKTEETIKIWNEPATEKKPAKVEKITEITDVVSYGEEVSVSDAVERLERQRVVKVAPRLDDIARETSRTNEISRIVSVKASSGRSAMMNETLKTTTEQEAASEFRDFLNTYIEIIATSQTNDPAALELVDSAHDMLDNLTFIGETERLEAVAGIAGYWKDYLRSNPEAQLCVLAAVSEGDEVKSDRFMLDGILGQFSDEDMLELGPRIVNNVHKITADPENVKIVFIDDWIITGEQMLSAISTKFRGNNIGISAIPAELKPQVEIQLITSPRHRIEQGFRLSGYGSEEDVHVPVRSYFLSHDAQNQTRFKQHNSYESGAHSSVDYDFEVSYIRHMLDFIDAHAGSRLGVPRVMPPLTNINRPYRKSKLENVRRLYESWAKSDTESRVESGV